MLKLAQCKLTSENLLFDWSREMSLEELVTSFSTETAASSWAWMAVCEVLLDKLLLTDFVNDTLSVSKHKGGHDEGCREVDEEDGDDCSRADAARD